MRIDFIGLIIVFLIALQLDLFGAGGSISGQALDSQTGNPLISASVALHKAADSSLVTGLYTKENGKFIFDNLAYGKYYIKVSYVGYASLTDFNHLTIDLRNSLRYNKTYGILIDDLRLIDTTTQDTILVDTLITELFTTALPVYSIEEVSAIGNVILANDELSVKFNRKLQSDSTDLGRILSIKQVTGEDTVNQCYLFEDVNSDSWLSEDSLSIIIKPETDFDLNEEYVLYANASFLTGDENDNGSYAIRIKKYMELNINSICNNPFDILPFECSPLNGNKGFYVEPDSDFVIESQEYIGEYFFLGWKCENDTTIDGNTNNQITINKSANELIDLIVTAVYAKIPNDTVRTQILYGGATRIVTTNGSSIDSTNNILPRFQDYEVVIRALPEVGYRFVEWQSIDTTFNGRTDISLSVPAFVSKTDEQLESKLEKKNFDSPMSGFEYPEVINPYTLEITPVFVAIPPDDPQVQRVCFQVVYHEPGETIPSNFYIQDFIYTAEINNVQQKYNFINPNNDRTIAEVCQDVCLNSPDCGIDVDFIIDPASLYVIEHWSTSAGYYPQGGSETNKLDNESGFSFSETMRQAPYNTLLVTVHVRKRRFDLDVEIQQKDLHNLRYNTVTADPIVSNALLKRGTIDDRNTIFIMNNSSTDPFIEKIIYKYEVKIEDSPEILPSLLDANKGMKLGYWEDQELGYTFLTVIDQATKKLRINNVMENKKCRFNYLSDFQLVKVRYMRMVDLTTDGSKPDDTPLAWLEYTKDQNFGENFLAEVALRESTTIVDNDIWTGFVQYTTQIELEFNNDVDPSSLTGNALWVEDYIDPNTGGKWFRYDGKTLQTYLGTGNNVAVDGKIIQFKLLSTQGLQIPKMSFFNLHITNNIKDINGNVLLNPKTIKKRTEFPGSRIYMEGFKLRMDTDPGISNDVLIHSGAACYYENIMNGDKLNFYSFAKEPNLQMAEGMAISLDLMILNVQRLCENSVIGYGTHVIDPDYGRTVDSFIEIINKVKGELDKEVQTTWALGSALAGAASAYTWNGINSDDELSIVNFLGTYRDFWGLNKSPVPSKILYKWFHPMLDDKNYHYFKMILY
jgi:hypothetical protein